MQIEVNIVTYSENDPIVTQKDWDTLDQSIRMGNTLYRKYRYTSDRPERLKILLAATEIVTTTKFRTGAMLTDLFNYQEMKVVEQAIAVGRGTRTFDGLFEQRRKFESQIDRCHDDQIIKYARLCLVLSLLTSYGIPEELKYVCRSAATIVFQYNLYGSDTENMDRVVSAADCEAECNAIYKFQAGIIRKHFPNVPS